MRRVLAADAPACQAGRAPLREGGGRSPRRSRPIASSSTTSFAPLIHHLLHHLSFPTASQASPPSSRLQAAAACPTLSSRRGARTAPRAPPPRARREPPAARVFYLCVVGMCVRAPLALRRRLPSRLGVLPIVSGARRTWFAMGDAWVSLAHESCGWSCPQRLIALAPAIGVWGSQSRCEAACPAGSCRLRRPLALFTCSQSKRKYRIPILQHSPVYRCV